MSYPFIHNAIKINNYKLWEWFIFLQSKYYDYNFQPEINIPKNNLKNAFPKL